MVFILCVLSYCYGLRHVKLFIKRIWMNERVDSWDLRMRSEHNRIKTTKTIVLICPIFFWKKAMSICILKCQEADNVLTFQNFSLYKDDVNCTWKRDSMELVSSKYFMFWIVCFSIPYQSVLHHLCRFSGSLWRQNCSHDHTLCNFVTNCTNTWLTVFCSVT